ncbi:unnamed protein product [Hymenolepis diminuta]|uniref:FXYD domain-containing ion transport regulator n=1 Tax=Hymenolepis diminuta TaxID=6216 RepID=A0A0R3SK50_HYMDI|nr:unnamed protein product [Hymenolepis diminuta]
MTTSTIPLKVQCEAFHLTGINKLRCAIAGTNDPAASKYVYILCSAEGVSVYTFIAELISHMERGEIPMTLTGGEMIGLGVAGISLFSLLITGCILLRNRSKGGTIITNAHNRGELV